MVNKLWAAVAAGGLVVVAGAVAVAFAADWTPGMGGKHKGARGGGSNAMLIKYDTNKDGQITRAEVDAAIEAEFKSADINADGKLDPAELQKYNDARKAERKARYDAWKAKNPDADSKERPQGDRGRAGFDPMKNMDWNQDGYVTPDEFGGRIRAQVMRADKDGDGNIAVTDLKRHRGKEGDEKKD